MSISTNHFEEFPIRSFFKCKQETPDQTNQLFEMASGLICHGGFDARMGIASPMDVTVLVVASLLVWLLVNRENHYEEYHRTFRFCDKKAHPLRWAKE